MECAFQILPHIYLDIEDNNFKGGKNKGLHRGWRALAFHMTVQLSNRTISLLLVFVVFLIGIHGFGLTSKSNY